ncbi:MAG TPA: hypothetical protein VJ831_14035 [Jatrophihabitantaceae bacterium]|nr:hypothetical protein [Jatrophihabitantaceae bacterium]
MSLRRRFWTEVVLASAALLFAVLTLLWKDWIEVVFGIDPDHHSGATEWLIAAVATVAALAFAIAARFEYRRARLAM